MILDLAWWNTNLSGHKHKPDSLKRASAATSINELLQASDLDILGLCEVSAIDIAEIRKHINISIYEVLPLLDKAGSSGFYMCLIFRKALLTLVKNSPVITTKNRSNLKIAQYIELMVTGESEALHLYLSHWPSRLRNQKNEKRVIFGTRLRDQIDVLLRANEDANIILMGDYNDEPFDPAVADELLASRDRSLVEKNGQLFYNPFWRHLSNYDHSVGKLDECDRGTYFNRSGDLTTWWTLDQIIFSSSFLRPCIWRADEKQTRVVQTSTFINLLSQKKGMQFDHLPIISRIERVAST